VYQVKFLSQFPAFFGCHGLEHLIVIGKQLRTFRAALVFQRLFEFPDPRICHGLLPDFAAEYHAGRRCTADYRGIGTLERGNFHIFIERLGEHHESATVIAGNNAKHNRSLEIDHSPADLGAVFQLPAAH